MKILKVRFKNLNSLTGEWEIDFTHPAYTADGLFAITGPTGAGKSTVLDSICLALYGSTPRLGRITQASNEILARGTGECLAEVTFATQSGSYRCCWSQRRARKHSDGALQQPVHEIAHADTGVLIDSTLRGVVEQVEAKTGMDFDRFTRSMLLAQGGFAAFLQAKPDERAPILEQITGTAIYSQISMQVHEIRSQHRGNLDRIVAELGALQLLSDEEEQLLNSHLAQNEAEETESSRQLEVAKAAIAWLNTLAKLEEDLERLAGQQIALQERATAFGPERQRLLRATQALEFDGDHAALSAVRSQLRDAHCAVAQHQETLPALVQAAEQSGAVLNSATQQLGARKEKLQKQAPLLQQVSELDLRIQEKEAPIAAARKAFAIATAEVARLDQEHLNLARQQQQQNAEREKLEAEKSATETDLYLAEKLPAWRARIEDLVRIGAQRLKRQEEAGKAKNRLLKAQEQNAKQKELLLQAQAEFSQQDQQRNQLDVALQQQLEAREASSWRQGGAILAARLTNLERALALATQRADAQSALESLSQRRVQLLDQEKQLSNRIAERLQQQEAARNLESAQLCQLELLREIDSLTEKRDQLRDGAPCPLCGALEHPFAVGAVPQPSEGEQLLSATRQKLRRLEDEISALHVAQAGNSAEQRQVEIDFAAKEESIRETSAALATLTATLAAELQIDASALTGQLQDLRQETAAQSQRNQNVLARIEPLEASFNKVRNQLELAAKRSADAELAAQQAAHEEAAAQAESHRLSEEAVELQNQFTTSLAALNVELASYGLSAETANAANQHLHALEVRRDLWLARQKRLTDLERDSAALQASLDALAAQVEQARQELGGRQSAQQMLLSELERLREQRIQLFADRSPGEEKRRLEATLLAAEQTQEMAQAQDSQAQQQLRILQTLIRDLSASIALLSQRHEDEANAFVERLSQSDFANEDAYLEVRLSESERASLNLQAQHLTNEQTALSTSIRDTSEQLKAQSDRQVTTESAESLQLTEVRLGEELKVLRDAVSRLRGQLNGQRQLKGRQHQSLLALEAQRSVCERWNNLHQLIGSADGKKFRNFAQGLTFERMVALANLQLRKLTDRYLLFHDNTQPLELQVVDSYQADQVRSTRNLSGGESFLVSLALALGLSHMASRNVRVDSLFLDEGFGSLDEDTLQTALDTLSSLQQEGKVIGVISHIPALKEQIRTQIQVEPQTEGRSSLAGPGCKML